MNNIKHSGITDSGSDNDMVPTYMNYCFTMYTKDGDVDSDNPCN